MKVTDNEKETVSELREDVRRLKQEVSFFQILFMCHLLFNLAWGIKYNNLVEAINLITERLNFLDKAVELSYETDKALFDIIEELVCQLQRAFEVLRW